MLPGMGGGGNMDPRKLQQMMQKLGIDIEEIEDVEEVVIRTATEDLVFDDADVTVMEAQGSRTYQVTGNPASRAREGAEDAEEAEPELPFTEEDVEVVVDRAGVSEEEAREALEAADGQPAEAIVALTEG